MVLKAGHQLAHDLCFRPQAEGDENDDDKNFDIYSMVHIVEEQKQGWHIVSQIFSSAFEILKSINPHLKHAYIRSDNAGCYHALPLMGYLWKFRNELSLDVKQYDFSEAQSGKDLCDSRTGTCRLHMLNYINEGNDITNGKQMKKALESHGGIKNMYISVTFGDSKIPETKPASIKSFRYNASFPCFDPNCILEFKKEDQLLKHLSVGKHVVDDEKQDSIIDTSKRLWSAKCQDIRFNQPLISSVGLEQLQDQTKTNIKEQHGYALKKRKKAVRFSPKVKDYLAALFNAGELSGKKQVLIQFPIKCEMRLTHKETDFSHHQSGCLINK
ncbi:unnamed protein product [Mytilus edulis]|uniref:C2H2-type domain-containing protein n=1 Tax=Mytilus edulis TaxID=6550 RepID=A0A8S3VMJ3_MYTED|nr:unnamed protein product [Mytilus edulis]